MWFLATGITIFFVVSVISSPLDVSSSKLDHATITTTAINSSSGTPNHANHTIVFVINIYAVKNSSGNTPRDVLHDDFINQVSEDTADPLARFLLIVEDNDNDTHPVDLDDVAEDLNSEGFATQKVIKDGTTQIIKVDLNSMKTKTDNKGGNEIDENSTTDVEDKDVDEKHGKLVKVRGKRSLVEEIVAFKKKKKKC